MCWYQITSRLYFSVDYYFNICVLKIHLGQVLGRDLYSKDQDKSIKNIYTYDMENQPTLFSIFFSSMCTDCTPIISLLYVVIFIDFFYLVQVITLSKLKLFLYILLTNIMTVFLLIPIAFMFLFHYGIFGLFLNLYIIEKEPSLLFIKDFFPIYSDYPDPENLINFLKIIRNDIIFILTLGLVFILTFYISLYTKYILLKKWLKIKNQNLLKKVCFKANLTFYIFLSVIIIFFSMANIFTFWVSKF